MCEASRDVRGVYFLVHIRTLRLMAGEVDVRPLGNYSALLIVCLGDIEALYFSFFVALLLTQTIRWDFIRAEGGKL